MTDPAVKNPAEQAAEIALAKVYECIDGRKSFLLEAGAGAGKTETLVRAIRYVIQKQGNTLLREHQRIACITYTNVASDEIKSRTDRHEAILSSTIHAFCWSLIKDFQPWLRGKLGLIEGWPERLEEAGGIGSKRVEYEHGYPKAGQNLISLGHNDVLKLTVVFLENRKFRDIFAARYPIVFIDEYQDTNKEFVDALKLRFLDSGDGPLIGLFGDAWQKIYREGCGSVEHPRLTIIGQKSNFRSVKEIVVVLNKMRPELPQDVVNPDAAGSVSVYHTNEWPGERRTEPQWKGDLPSDIAHEYLEKLKLQLTLHNWSFAPDKTKVLMLTHNVLAAEQGYSNLADVFEYNDAFIRKEDPQIAYFSGVLEPVCVAYKAKRFGEMIDAMGSSTPAILTHTDKLGWAQDMDALLELRETGSIGAVLDHLIRTKRPRLADIVEHNQQQLNIPEQDLPVDRQPAIERLRKLRDIPYEEVIALTRFIDGHTVFSTKHGVKGAEFENVVVVFGRGWNLYNFNQMFELFGTDIHPNKLDFYERNRNLFYVACSRPKKRLALFFTQHLSPPAIKVLTDWFGADNMHGLVE